MHQRNLCLDKSVPYVDLADHNLVKSSLLVVLRGKIETGCSVRLRVGIDDEYLFLKHSQ